MERLAEETEEDVNDAIGHVRDVQQAPLFGVTTPLPHRYHIVTTSLPYATMRYYAGH